jgi:DNA-binding MarR family transcriptional regulator
MDTHDPRLEVSPISRSPGRKLYRAHTLLRVGLTQIFHRAQIDLSTEQWALLSHLWEQDGLTQLELGARMDKDRPSLSRLVDFLEERGLVRRQVSSRDHRLRQVKLTAKGRAAQTPCTRLATRYVREVFAGVTRAELDAFLRTLDHIIGRLDPHARTTANPVADRSAAAPARFGAERAPHRRGIA